MRRHRQDAPDSAAAVPHLRFEPGWRLRVALVLRRDLLERRSDQLAVQCVTPHAGILARDAHGIGGRRSGGRVSSERALTGRGGDRQCEHRHGHGKPPLHFATGAGLPGCTSEFLTGAGACTPSGVELTDESGTAPTVASSLADAAAGALAPDASAADNA